MGYQGKGSEREGVDPLAWLNVGPGVHLDITCFQKAKNSLSSVVSFLVPFSSLIYLLCLLNFP